MNTQKMRYQLPVASAVPTLNYPENFLERTDNRGSMFGGGAGWFLEHVKGDKNDQRAWAFDHTQSPSIGFARSFLTREGRQSTPTSSISPWRVARLGNHESDLRGNVLRTATSEFITAIICIKIFHAGFMFLRKKTHFWCVFYLYVR